MAWVRVEEHDLVAAEDLLEEVPQLTSAYDSRLLQAVHALVRARLLLADGHPDLARASVRAVRPGAERGASWLDHALVVSESESLLASGRPQEAASLHELAGDCHHEGCALQVRRVLVALGQPSPDTAGAGPRPAGSVQVEVESLLVTATQLLREDQPERAERAVEAALQLALPEHLRRPFLQSAPEVRDLLDATGRTSRLMQAPARGRTQAAPEVPLTAREQEVLSHLGELLTTEEIAQAMFVSVNTVRSHVRSVLRKLDVTRRNEAVRRAWELGLLRQGPDAPSGPGVRAGRPGGTLPLGEHPGGQTFRSDPEEGRSS
jgi:LuxR family maltose regulon positive regulatory protein